LRLHWHGQGELPLSPLPSPSLWEDVSFLAGWRAQVAAVCSSKVEINLMILCYILHRDGQIVGFLGLQQALIFGIDPWR
jgi:hypothetical protein